MSLLRLSRPLARPLAQPTARSLSSSAASSGRSARASRAAYLAAGAALGVSALLAARLLVDRSEPVHAEAARSPAPRGNPSGQSEPRGKLEGLKQGQSVGSVSILGGKSSVPDISALDAAVVTDINAPMRQRMETYVKLLQHRIVSTLGAEETGDKGFFVDSWLRKEGGEGISCVLQDGQTFEKAGVNISIVHGNLPPRAIAQMSADHAGLVEKVGYNLGLGSSADAAEVRGLPFYATGLSLVVHPRNPSAPTVHFNYRYFELTHPEKLADGSPNPRFDPAQPDKPVAWWFGGGTDLTPMVLFPEDAEHFHSVLKKTADRHDPALYPAWKRWCDRYFWIPHRGEARGVGGIFFDDLTIPPGGSSARLLLSEGKPNPADTTPERPLPTQREHTKETLFAVVRSLGDAFLPAYLPLLQRRKNAASTPALQRWQALRRGRYVEFNLVYDRGTKFGLQTPGARIESILMSLPLHARFEYLERHSGVGQVGEQDEPDEDPKQAQRERDTMRVLRRPHDWVR